MAEQDVVPSLTTTTTISADLPDASGVGAGTVTVTDGVDSCAAAVADGKCSITLTTAGSRMLTATYAGNSNFRPGSSGAEQHTVNPPSSQGGGVPPQHRPLQRLAVAREEADPR